MQKVFDGTYPQSNGIHTAKNSATRRPGRRENTGAGVSPPGPASARKPFLRDPALDLLGLRPSRGRILDEISNIIIITVKS